MGGPSPSKETARRGSGSRVVAARRWTIAAFVVLAGMIAASVPTKELNAHPHEAASKRAAPASGSPANGVDVDAMRSSDPHRMTMEASDGGTGEEQGDAARPVRIEVRAAAWFGAWHPALVHFPIALPVAAVLLELLAWWRGNPVHVANNPTLIAIACAGAFVAAGSGWADAGLPSAEDDWQLTLHRVLGSAIPFLLAAGWIAGARSRPSAPGRGGRPFSILLALTLVFVLVQGYLGGELTHGADHMAFEMEEGR